MKRGLWILALAAVLYFVGVAVQVRYDRRSVREIFETGSVLNTSDDGLSLAYGYLKERVKERAAEPDQVEMLRRRVAPEVVPERGVVFRVEPSEAPLLLQEPRKDEGAGAPLLTGQEEAWVRGGGRLVLAISGPYGQVSFDPIQGVARIRKVFPLWPGVSRLAPEKVRALAGAPLAAGHAVFLAGEGQIVSRLPIGAGEVIVLSTPEIFRNGRIAQADHLALLEALSGIAEGRPVRFDERAHGLGETAGVLATLGGWGLGPLLLLAGLTAALAVWRAAVRIGPPERDDRDTRSDAVELVDSLADLYDRALGRGDAIRLYHESFLHAVAAETGLRGPSLEARARDLLAAAGSFELPATGQDLPRDRFERALHTLNDAFRRLQDAKRK